MTHRDRARDARGPVRQPPQTHLEIKMDSALTPREIQARIRSGEPLQEVARAAGMDVDWVEPFAAPVIAEREFIAGQAQGHPVRRGGETIAHRTLGQVVADRLTSRRVDLETVTWDAWKLEGRRWQVAVDYDSGKAHRAARFIYDASGRFSVADNDDARWLLGLQSASHGPQPGRRRREEEAEPTIDLNDDLARRGIRLHLAEVKGPVQDRLAQSPLWSALSGEVHLSAGAAFDRLANAEDRSASPASAPTKEKQ